ncbi:MAG: glycosyltransferase family 39 protein [Candidatus Pacebacteria bacterium]|nr:glycosyltransferase family 39 protein [Candidatus Paceibacterota bacterium]
MAKDSQKKLSRLSGWALFILILFLAFGLRIYRFNQIPLSLFGDEVDTGYQAYSILKTGRDYFGNFWPIHFESFGDWRMPLYIYLAVPLMAVLGPTELAIRLPALIFSLISIWVTYRLVKEITRKEKIALLSCFLLAISPWQFHFSRVALEVVLFNLLLLSGLWFLLSFIKESKNSRLVFSSVCLALSLYAYSTAKLFVPLLIFSLWLLFKKELVKKKPAIFFWLPFLLISLPMIKDVFFGQGAARFGNIAIWSDSSIAEQVRLQREICSLGAGAERVLHNKFSVIGRSFLANYFKSFSGEFLFLTGDPNPRHNPTGQGQVFWVLAPLIVLGLVRLLGEWQRSGEKKLLIPVLILALTPIPAALTQNGGTHAIRTYQSLPWWQFLAALGFSHGIFLAKNKICKKLFTVIFALGLAVSSFSFFHLYFNHFPHQPGSWWRWWNWGYREVFEYLDQSGSDYQRIYLSPAYDPPIVYALFYSRYPPRHIQEEISLSPIGFSKFVFANPDLSFLKTGEEKEGDLFIVTPGYALAMGYNFDDYQTIKILKKIAYPDGETAFFIFKTL